jgi:hypothetical protein
MGALAVNIMVDVEEDNPGRALTDAKIEQPDSVVVNWISLV